MVESDAGVTYENNPRFVYLSNQEKDIITQVANTHLQLAEFSGCEKDAECIVL